MSRAAICWIFAVACSGKSEAPRPGSADPVNAAVPDDAGTAVRPTEPTPGRAVASGADPEGTGRTPARPAARGRPIDVILRSSPAGALAAVDGVPIGPTPTYWAGEANGREHEFTFVLTGYAFARYRFVPITSGVVHARLEVLAEETDAGVPAELQRVPPDALKLAPAAEPRGAVPPAVNPPPSEPGAAPAPNGGPAPAADAGIAPHL